MSRGCIVLLCALLGACASNVTISYLTLVSTGGAAVLSDEPRLSVGPIIIPDYLKRNGLAVRDSGARLRYLDGEHWAEPLDKGIQRVLSANLGQELQTSQIIPFPSMAALRADYRVAVDVLVFEAERETVTLEARWHIQAPGAAVPAVTALFKKSVALRDFPSGARGIARGMSSLLASLSTEVASGIRDQRRASTSTKQ